MIKGSKEIILEGLHRWPWVTLWFA